MSWTGAWSSSASSTRRDTPSGVRATRPRMSRGFSAPTSIRASSVTAPGSPTGGVVGVSFGTRRRVRSSAAIGSSCKVASATSTTGPCGGVIAILKARTADSPKWVSDAGVSSHLV